MGIKPQTKGQDKLIAAMYRNLAKDARRVKERQFKYAREALGEKKASTLDFMRSQKKGLLASAVDDMHETDICEDFADYRKSVAKDYAKREQFYLQQAKKYERL